MSYLSSFMEIVVDKTQELERFRRQVNFTGFYRVTFSLRSNVSSSYFSWISTKFNSSFTEFYRIIRTISQAPKQYYWVLPIFYMTTRPFQGPQACSSVFPYILPSYTGFYRVSISLQSRFKGLRRASVTFHGSYQALLGFTEFLHHHKAISKAIGVFQ